MTSSLHETSGDADRRYGIGQWIAWAVIVLSIVTIVSLPVALRERLRGAAEKASEERPDVQFLLAGRYVIGVERALPLKALSGAHGDAIAGKLVGSLASQAKTGPDKLRAAIVRGEIEGKNAALHELDLLEATDPALQGDADLLRGIYQGDGAPLGTPEWQDFQQRHGWFADLAASFGKAASDPLCASVLSAGLRTVATTVGMFCFFLIAVTVGLVLLIIGITFWFQGKLRCAFGKARLLPADRRASVEAFAIYLGGIIALGFMIKYVLNIGGLWGVAALPVAFGAAMIWPRLRGQTWSQWRAIIGLHRGRGIWREFGAGAIGYLAGLPIFALGMLLMELLSAAAHTTPTHPIIQEISTNPWTIAGLLLLASVWAPISEELMFRGALFAHLRGRLGWWSSAIGVSFIFAIIHPQGWTALPALASLALALAAIREWRGSILGCMMAHAINNTIMIIALVLMIG